MTEPEISVKVLQYADVISGIAEVRLAAGSPGRYAALSSRVGDIAISPTTGVPQDDAKRAISIERRVWTRACQRFLTPAVRIKVAASVASAPRRSSRRPDPWYGIDPEADALMEQDIGRRELQAERVCLNCIKAHMGSERFGDLEQAARVLGELATVRERATGNIPVDEYEVEASRLTAGLHELPSPARRFLLRLVKENYKELAGDPSATVPADVWDRGRDRRRGVVYEWITNGRWDLGWGTGPDTDGVWFVEDLQEEYHVRQVHRQVEVDRAEAEAATSAEAAVRAEQKEGFARAEAEERAKRTREAAAAKERKEEAAAEGRRRKAQAALERRMAKEAEARKRKAELSSAELAASIRAEYDEAVRTTSERLVAMGVEPTRDVVRGEFNRAGRFREWGGLMNSMPGFESESSPNNPQKPRHGRTRVMRSPEKFKEDLLAKTRDDAVRRYAKNHGVRVAELPEDLVEKIRRNAC